MKRLIRKLVEGLRVPLDLVFVVLSVPAAVVLLAYRKIGSWRLNMTTAMLKKIGVFPIRNHYYEPLFDDSKLLHSLDEERFLPGIDLNEAGQQRLLQQLHFESEILRMQWNQPSKAIEQFQIVNGSFEAGDAEFLYQFLRFTRPSHVIEIGGGNSTKVANLALRKNNQETEFPAIHTCIEPYEMKWLEKLEGIRLIRKRLEDCDIVWPKALQSGDLLFIDSSHIIRPQGDVLMEYLEILPQLASGVYVHIHDIFTPFDYPQEWVSQNVRFWNEQYLLEAVLQNSSRYEVVAGVDFLYRHYPAEFRRVCPHLTPGRRGGSFYIRVQ